MKSTASVNGLPFLLGGSFCKRRRHMTRVVTAVIFAAGCLALAGCPSRVAVFAPRLNNTDFHREAIEKKNCADCHESEKIRDHKPQDDCTACHTVCRGC